MTVSRCPNCNTLLDSDDLFCGECGQAVRAQAPPVPSFSPSPPPPQSSLPAFPPPPTTTSPPPAAPPSFSPPPPPASRAASSPPPPPPDYQDAKPPKKKRSGCLIGAVVLIVLLACLALLAYGVVTLLPDIIPPEFNFGTPTPMSPGLPSTGLDAPITVENFSGVPICFLFISSSSNDDWGEDWLGTTGMIEDGESLTFWFPADQTVDLRAEDCDGGYDEQFDVYVPVEGITYTLSP